MNACKSHGLNGIQNMCLLKPGRLRDRLVRLQQCRMSNNKMETNSENSDSDEFYDDSCDEESSDITESVDPADDDSLPYGSVADENEPETEAETTKPTVHLTPATPSVILETKRDAFSSHLQMFCLSQPVSVVRGLGNALKLDLSLFSTKTLVEQSPGHIVETRTQKQQATTDTEDAATATVTSINKQQWPCESSPSFTTLLKYAKYQAHTFQEAVKEEKAANDASNKRGGNQLGKKSTAVSVSSTATTPPSSFHKTIKFGTNVDLSDEVKWRAQSQELAKLPAFMRCVSPGNMLSHIGYKIDGVNSLQMYLKVPGCRTPGHQENNNMCSLNMNIGPGDCEWFAVDERYWRRVEALCEQNGVDYLTGSWWPVLDDLHRARIPVYRFLQKPGDLVWVNVGCVHWVQSIGWCNNVSWNAGPMCYMQYKSAMERYEWNRLRFFKSIVPMLHLSWQLARNVKITDRRLYEYIKHVLMHSLKQSQLAINYIENCGCELKHQARLPDEPAHYCYDCDAEVFNILFISEQPISESAKTAATQTPAATQHVVHCQACARKRNHLLDNFVILSQYDLGELKQVYDAFQLYVVNTNVQNIFTNMSSVVSSNGSNSSSSTVSTVLLLSSQSSQIQV